MKCLLFILILSTVLIGSCDYDSPEMNIPDSIELVTIELIGNDKGTESLSQEIYGKTIQVLADSIFDKDGQYKISSPVLVDLDNDGKRELIALFGSANTFAFLGVFCELEDFWQCVFYKGFEHHYEGVGFNIHELTSNEKILTIKNLESRGSGIYLEATHFYSLVEEKFIHCLRIVSDARIHGWALPINQTVESEFELKSLEENECIMVQYNYNFFAGPDIENEPSWISHPEISLFRGLKDLDYVWNKSTRVFEPQFETSELTQHQLMAFEEFGNDTLLTQAFKEDLEEILLGDDEVKKEIVNRLVKRD